MNQLSNGWINKSSHILIAWTFDTHSSNHYDQNTTIYTILLDSRDLSKTYQLPTCYDVKTKWYFGLMINITIITNGSHRLKFYKKKRSENHLLSLTIIKLLIFVVKINYFC